MNVIIIHTFKCVCLLFLYAFFIWCSRKFGLIWEAMSFAVTAAKIALHIAHMQFCKNQQLIGWFILHLLCVFVVLLLPFIIIIVPMWFPIRWIDTQKLSAKKTRHKSWNKRRFLIFMMGECNGRPTSKNIIWTHGDIIPRPELHV